MLFVAVLGAVLVLGAADLPPWATGSIAVAVLVAVSAVMFRLTRFQGASLRELIQDQANRSDELERENTRLKARLRWTEYRLNETARTYREGAGHRLPPEFYQDDPPADVRSWPKLGDSE